MSPVDNLEQIDMEKTMAFFEKLKAEQARLKDSTTGTHSRGDQKTTFMPYVMIRSCAGDKGARPLPTGTPFWESPDIWTATGSPSVTPDIPDNQGGTVIVGQQNTVYAHVWNLGRAPIAGARVEWYWFNPTLGIDGAHANLIGVAGVELSPRGFPGCHKLVKCPQPWIPVLENGGHECIVVRVSALGDTLNASHEWDASADRHVAQKNLSVVAAGSNVDKLIDSLDATRPKKSTVRLYQLGQEAKHALTLAAPHLKLDPAVKPALLAELNSDGNLTLAPLHESIPRVMPHILLNLGGVPKTPLRTFKTTNVEQPILLHEDARIPDLLHHGKLLSPEVLQRLNVLPFPKQGEAHALRLVSYKDDKPVGGYTIIVSGS